MTIIRVPTPLRPYTGGAKEVEASGETVAAALGDLVQRFPDLQLAIPREQIAWRTAVAVRGVKSLPVQLQPA